MYMRTVCHFRKTVTARAASSRAGRGLSGRNVVLVEGVRTPFLTSGSE